MIDVTDDQIKEHVKALSVKFESDESVVDDLYRSTIGKSNTAASAGVTVVEFLNYIDLAVGNMLKAEKKKERGKDAKEGKHSYSKKIVPFIVHGSKIYETISYGREILFLCYDKQEKKFSIEETVSTTIGKREIEYFPIENTPYEHYLLDPDDKDDIGILNKKLKDFSPITEPRYEEVYNEFDTFLDMDDIEKVIGANYNLLSYNQHKVKALPYQYLYGPEDSGKSRYMEMFLYMGYRPMKTTALTAPNIYRYLGTEQEGTGMILIDQFEFGLEDIMLMSLCLEGYRKGAKIARMDAPEQGGKQQFYKVFSPKIFASVYLPSPYKYRELISRCHVINMLEGEPKKDEITDEDENRFNEIRTKLLMFRMMTYFDPYPISSMSLKGRFKELWKPILQTASTLTCRNNIEQYLKNTISNKRIEKSEGFDATIIKTVVDSISSDNNGVGIPMNVLWNKFNFDIGGQIIEETKYKKEYIKSEIWGDVTKQKFGGKLKYIFGVKSRATRNESVNLRQYNFDIAKVSKLCKRYYYQEGVDKLENLLHGKDVK